MKKILIVILILAGVFAVAGFSTVHYITLNKLPGEIRNIDVAATTIATTSTYADEFPHSVIDKIINGDDGYYFIDLYVNITNKKNRSYYRWRYFALTSEMSLYKVWVTNREPESYSQRIEPTSVYEGDHLHVIIYKENSSTDEIKTIFEENVKLFAIGRLVF